MPLIKNIFIFFTFSLIFNISHTNAQDLKKIGKYMNNKLPKGSRLQIHKDFWTRYNKPNTNKAIELYYKIAKKNKLDLAQMCLKFLEIQPFVTSVIIGATTMEQLKTNIESVNINLTDDIIKEINEVQTIYPNPCQIGRASCRERV